MTDGAARRTVAGLRRSWLFVPGAADRFVRRLPASRAHAVILDLEDGLDPDERDGALLRIAALVGQRRPDLPALYVRPSAVGRPTFEADVAAARGPGLCGLVLPKVEGPDDVEAALSALGADGEDQDERRAADLVIMVETARGLEDLPRILRASERVVGVAVGAEDLTADVGVPPGGDAAARRDFLDHVRMRVVTAAAAAGVAVRIDGPPTELDDVGQQIAEAARLRGLGFSGRMAVHPRQLEPLHAGFQPSAAEVAWARRVRAAPAAGAQRVGSAMVDAPVRRQALRILEEAGET